MNELTQNEQSAKFHHDTALTLANSAVEQAVISGRFLLAVKEECGHGNYLKRLEVMGITRQTANDYIRLSNNLNDRRAGHLGIKAALAYLSANDSVKAQIDTKLGNCEKVTAEEIKKLKKDAEEWKQQALDKDHALTLAMQKKKLAEADLRLAREAKKTIVYVTDDNKAVENVIAATAKEMESLKAKLSNTELVLATERKKVDAINREHKAKLSELDAMSNMRANEELQRRLKDHADKIEHLQKHEASLRANIAYLQPKREELNAELSTNIEELASYKSFLQAKLDLSAAGAVILNDDFLEKTKMREKWLEQINGVLDMANFYLGSL